MKTMDKYNVIDSFWFEKIGIVKVETKFSGIKFYIGKGDGKNQQEDEQRIARLGMPVPVHVMLSFFKIESND